MEGILLKYYQDELGVILIHMKLLDEAVSMQDVHRIRVGIKRIKAIHRMLGASFPDKFRAKQLNRPYKNIFKTLGVYRETSLSINILRRLSGSRKLRMRFKDYLEPLLNETRDGIKTALQEFDSQNTISDTPEVSSFLSELNHEQEISMISRYIGNQRLRAYSLLQQSEGYEELHSIRIILKNIKPFLKLMAASADSSYSPADYKKLNRAESMIGDWHDRRVLSETFEAFFKDESEHKISSERSYNRLMRRIERKEGRDLKPIREKIIVSLDIL